MKHVAILGAGGVGACAALELAGAGVRVDIFEQHEAPLQAASRVNEGKIHQGFIYAKDGSERTARLMAQGALTFSANLARWIDVRRAMQKSTPFFYAVHKDTMLPVEAIRAHFTHCCETFNAMQAETGAAYIDTQEPAFFREASGGALADRLDPQDFLTGFETSEHSVDPRPIAAALANAITSAAHVTLITQARVTAVARRERGGFSVTYQDRDGVRESAPYEAVINATWEDRLAIDQTMGLTPPQSWSYRHKFGTRVKLALAPNDLPSVTCVLGPFGDLVNFGENGLYLSWYPEGMTAMTSDLAPPRSWSDLTRKQRLPVFKRSLRAWRALCPKLGDLVFDDDAIDPVSGVIFAWGDTDIDDAASHLHTRFEIGVHSVDGYHSVNTGKFTLVPYFGKLAADRVLGRDSVR